MYVRLALGDGDDLLTVAGVGVDADGGPGPDELTGGDSDDTLSGGGGDDALHGGRGADPLSDGDPDAAAGPDVLDGGPGRDTLSYEHRAAPVIVTLGNGEVAGAPGEGDEITALEYLEGGLGDDVLIAGGPGSGYGYAHGLDGGPAMTGSSAAAARTGSPAARAPTSTPAGPVTTSWSTPTRRADRRRVRRRDLVLRRALAPVPVPEPRRGGPRARDVPRRVPVRRPLQGRAARVPRVADAQHARGPPPRARHLRRRRRFGRFLVRVALTRLGRRLAARQGGTRASVALRGPGIPPRTWTIALRVG